ncbi:MAG: transglutaminase-like domain-containing protein [Deltaproteobacteria bacterium]|nr:transglutaminase-like domain-containing protein [Deltaproteobacteria bacterium]
MNPPSFILAGSVIFWGWQTGLLVPAAIMAVVLASSSWLTVRWDFSTSDFNRISDLCVVLFLGMLLYAFASNRSNPVILVVLQWLPLSFFPLIASQIYSTRQEIYISSLFLLMRRKKSEEEKQKGKTINLTYPYFALCLLSASCANLRTNGFYLGLLVLSAWALLTARPKRNSLITWAMALLLAGAGGYLGHLWLHRLQATVEDKTIEWLSRFRHDETLHGARSRMGELGTLKLSDRIMFRVKMDSRPGSSLLLREGSYNGYRSSTWFAVRSSFEPLRPEEDERTWHLRTGNNEVMPGKDRAGIGSTSTLMVSTYLKGKKGILKLPLGSLRIENLPVATVEQNQYGTVEVMDGPGLINYRVHYASNALIDSPPTEIDLIVPPEEERGIEKTVAELGLEADSPREVTSRVAAYFRKNFSYSLTLAEPGEEGTSLENFLCTSRSAHCEYFAAATVLLLRKLKVPARYATGYAVHEYSDLEKAFVVRQRHAHAWALVYLDGRWQDLDTTPSSWMEAEEKAAARWLGLADLWSWCTYTLSKWRWGERRGGVTRYLGWLLVPLIVFLAWRVYGKKGVARIHKEQGDRRTQIRSGVDSEFYLITERLGELGFVRNSGETMTNLLARIGESQPPFISTESIHSLLELHYRYRFDPQGISPAERSALKSEVELWLAEHRL